MKCFQRVLCPVDLSKTSLSAVGPATQLAKQNNAKLRFLFVSPMRTPEEAMYGSQYLRQSDAANQKRFEEIRPTDDSVTFEHVTVQGNAGPEIVRASKEADCIVMSTHGRSAVMRFILGSVANYVLRFAKCPVVLLKGLLARTKQISLWNSMTSKNTT